MGSVNGGSVSRTRPANLVYSSPSNLESMPTVNSTEPVTPEFNLDTMSIFGKTLVMWIWAMVGF